MSQLLEQSLWMNDVISHLASNDESGGGEDVQPRTYHIEELQRLGTEFKHLQTKLNKITTAREEVIKEQAKIDAVATWIGLTETRVAEVRAELQGLVDGCRERQNVFIHLTNQYDGHFHQVDRYIEKLVTNMCEAQNAELYASYYHHLSILFQDEAKTKKTALVKCVVQGNSVTPPEETLNDCIKEELRAKFKKVVYTAFKIDSLDGLPPAAQVPSSTAPAVVEASSEPMTGVETANQPTAETITHPGVDVSNQPSANANSNTLDVVTLLVPTPTLPAPLHGEPATIPPKPAIRTSVSSFIIPRENVHPPVTLDDLPIDVSLIQVRDDITYYDYVENRLLTSVEIINRDYHNMTINKRPAQQTAHPNIVRWVKLLTEEEYIQKAPNFGWIRDTDPTMPADILLDGLFEGYLPSQMMCGDVVVHPGVILKNIPTLQPEISQNEMYEINNRNYPDSLKSTSHILSFEPNALFYAYRYDYLDNVLSMFQTIINIRNYLHHLPNCPPEVKAAITQLTNENIPFYTESSSPQCGVVIPPIDNRVDQLVGYVYSDVYHLVFNKACISNIVELLKTVFMSSLGSVPRAADASAEASAPVTALQLLVTEMRKDQAIYHLVGNFMFACDALIEECIEPIREIHLLNHPHWFVVYAFTSPDHYAIYQSTYLANIHANISSSWKTMLEDIVFFDPKLIPFNALRMRKTKIKKTDGPAGNDRPPTTRRTPPPPQGETKKRGRPPMSKDGGPPGTTITNQHGINRSNYKAHTLPTLPTPPADDTVETVDEQTSLLVSIKYWLDQTSKILCQLELSQHSYLSLKIPRSNTPVAPVPLTVPPYVFLPHEGRLMVKKRVADSLIHNQTHTRVVPQTYVTDLLNEVNPDTLLHVNGCPPDFVTKIEQTGSTTENDLLGAKCFDCGKKIRLRTVFKNQTIPAPKLSTKELNFTHCFGYIPCECRKLIRCTRCYILRWLWDYNLHLEASGLESREHSYESAMAFSLPCPECDIPWKLQELCLISFDDLCFRSGVKERCFSDPRQSRKKDSPLGLEQRTAAASQQQKHASNNL